MLKILQNALLVALGILLAAYLVDGIHYDSKEALILVVLLVTLFNAFLRPLLIVFTLPFVVFSLGLGVWLINAVLFFVAGRTVPGFHIDSFWDALWGAFWVSITTLLANYLLNRGRRPPGNGLGGRFHFDVKINRGGGTQPGKDTTRKSLPEDDDKIIDV